MVRFCSRTCTTSLTFIAPRQQLYVRCVWSVRAGGLAVTTRPLPSSLSVCLSSRSLATFPSQFRGDVRRLFASITNDFLASRAHHFHLDTQSARALSATNRNGRQDDRLRSTAQCSDHLKSATVRRLQSRSVLTPDAANQQQISLRREDENETSMKSVCIKLKHRTSTSVLDAGSNNYTR